MAKVKSFKAEYGCSFEFQNTWHKFYAGIEVEFEDGDDTQKVKEMAWNTIETEIEKKIKEVLS